MTIWSSAASPCRRAYRRLNKRSRLSVPVSSHKTLLPHLIPRLRLN